MTAAATPLDPGPGERVALMVLERAFLEALAVGLRDQGLEVVGGFDSSTGLLRGITRARPDVVLVSGVGNRIGAVALARAVRGRFHGVRVALLVEDVAASRIDFEHEPVDGVLRASLTLRRIAADLRRIAVGERMMPARWAVGRPSADPMAGLSIRQREILELIAGGQSTQEIAEVLHVSRNTVKYHVRKIYERLQVRTRVQAARMLHEAWEDHVGVGF